MSAISPGDMNWIRDLVRKESLSKKDFTSPETELKEHTLEFMKQLRLTFTTCAAVFNQMKGMEDQVRVYGLSASSVDFMLFRNGYKLLFSMKEPGLLAVQISRYVEEQGGKGFKPLAHQPMNFIKSKWGAFKELKWTYEGEVLHPDYLVCYYMSRFVEISKTHRLSTTPVKNLSPVKEQEAGL